MLEPSIRRAESADADSVYTMLCELETEMLNRGAFDTVFGRNIADENTVYLLAESEGKPVGFLSVHFQHLLHHVGIVAEIQELFVGASTRGQGIGKRLVSAANEEAERRGCVLLEVTCNMKRLDTHRFYERENFSKTHYKFTMPL